MQDREIFYHENFPIFWLVLSSKYVIKKKPLANKLVQTKVIGCIACVFVSRVLRHSITALFSFAPKTLPGRAITEPLWGPGLFDVVQSTKKYFWHFLSVDEDMITVSFNLAIIWFSFFMPLNKYVEGCKEGVESLISVNMWHFRRTQVSALDIIPEKEHTKPQKLSRLFWDKHIYNEYQRLKKIYSG